jgi:peptide/nickel transport system substrate-binding protein
MFTSQHYVPVGESATENNQVRLQDDALDDATAQLARMSPDEDDAGPVFTEALEAWFEAMPVIPTIQTVYTHQFNTTYWTGWPTDEDLYQVPNNWWGQFMFVIANLQPTGEE